MQLEISQFLVWIMLVAFLITAFLRSGYPKLKRWNMRRKLMDDIDAKYESLRNLRRNLVYHIDWAIDRGEPSQARSLEPEIERIDSELEELRIQYEELLRGKNPEGKSFK